MSTTTVKKPAARSKASSPKLSPKAAPKAAPKATAPKEQEPAASEPNTLIEALTGGQATLIKVRANGTRRSLPYLAVGTEGRNQAEAVAKMRTKGETVESIAEAMKVSTATARRFITNLELSQAVEAGEHDRGWKPGIREVVVHTVGAKQPKA